VSIRVTLQDNGRSSRLGLLNIQQVNIFALAAQGTIRSCRFGQGFHRVPPALWTVVQNVLFPVTAFWFWL